MATMAAGLEAVASSEIRGKIGGAEVHESLRGRVLFAAACALPDLLQLRCADNLYYHIARFPVGSTKADLPQLTEAVATLNLDEALSFYSVAQARHTRAYVNASRSGRHTYSRFDAAAAALQGLTAGQSLQAGVARLHDLEFRLDILGSEAFFGLKLTPSTFRFRGPGREFAPAALRPTVAHALVWLSNPKPTDVFLDPFSGSGTIVAERCAYDAAAIVASDVSPEAVASTRANTPGYVCVQQWDARHLEMAGNSVSAIVTNLPWGKQIEVAEGLEALYRGFLREARRVLEPGGRAIMLTDQDTTISSAAEGNAFSCQKLTTISLHGLLPSAYLLQPR